MSFERKNIQRMSGYTYGEQPADVSVIKLNTNENPYPASPHVQAALSSFSTSALRRYPPALANDFRQAAADLHGVGLDNIIATRGGDELLRLLFTTFADPEDVIAVTEPTYSLYPVLAEIQDARVQKFALNPDWSLPTDFAKKANQAGAKMTFVVNPHAPTGNLVGIDEINQLADELDSVLLVDEAYVDFIDPELGYSCLDLVHSHENVIFLRSMSKGYGLAGLRFGYGIGHTSLIEPMLTKTRDSYNLDAISQELARVALQDQTYAQSCWQKVRVSRSQLRNALTAKGFDVPVSQANFLLATVPEAGPSAESLYLGLKQRNILVRFFNTAGLDDKLRITIGTDEENSALLAALDELASHTA